MNKRINRYLKRTSFKSQLLLCLSSLFFFCEVTSQDIEINNVKPRLDTYGDIVDAHDGRVVQFNDRFYWYGTSYGTTNGFTTKNHYVCYSSKDLKVWKKEGRLLPNQPEGVYYRPHVVYNKKTKLYVLWYNWYPKLWNGQFGVATSKNPAGPFKIVNSNVKMFRSDVGLGDFGLFVDDDDTCYLSYNTIQNHQVSIEKLNKTYTASTMENGGIIAEHMEAGSQFKRKGKYYLITDYTCCFCNYGSGARVYISNNPLSGYEYTGNINRYSGKPSLVLNDGNKRGTIHEKLNKKEGAFDAVEIQFSEERQIKGITVSLFTGNRPENCGNVDNPRVHPEIVTPKFKVYSWRFNTWESITVSEEQVEKSALKETVSLKFSEFKGYRLKIEPEVVGFPFDNIYVNEIDVDLGQEIAPSSLKFYITGRDIPQRPIIPAQQTYVMALKAKGKTHFVWMGDLWGSASDNQKGHDYQYWSKPLEFYDNGIIAPLQWDDYWKL